MDFFDPYASGSDDEAEIDSLLLQSCTNTLAGTEEGEHKKKNLRSSVLKGVEDHLVEYKHEDGTVTREEFVPVVAPPSVMINTTNENETDDKPKVKLKNVCAMPFYFVHPYTDQVHSGGIMMKKICRLFATTVVTLVTLDLNV